MFSAIVGRVKAGDVIDGKYRIELLLGEGGMGRVFAASHMAIGSTVAIKVLRSEALASQEVPKRFMREARAAGRLRSEHVVRVIDVGVLQTGEPFMVMEMLHGHDLATRLAQGPMPIAQAVEYIVQACEGLAEAHGLGMVHRDVKPANLFVTARPNGAALIKVLDFGIATAATGDIDPRLTATQSVMGSPSYMSPEQLKGARDVDARSDIWSLGITLYELITGVQPFNGPTLTALSLSIVTDSHQRPANVPDALAAIIDRCLDKTAANRFPNVAELTRALAPFFGGGGVAADMVAGSYSMPVPPTLMGLDRQTLGTQPTIAPSPPMTSTTSLAAGETGTRLPQRSRKWVWISASVATIALGIGVGLAVGVSGNSGDLPGKPPTSASQVQQPPAPPPAITVEPLPVPEPIAKTVAPEPVVPPDKIEPVAKVGTKRPTTRRDKRPTTGVKRDPRTPVEPSEYTPGVPKGTTKPVDKTPDRTPDKTACAPNDPRCGL